MMDLWEIYKASKGVPHSGDLYDALMGKALGGAGSVWETDSAPYFFRQSGGLLNSRLLNKEKDCLVGASVPFNQLVQNGNFADGTGWSAQVGTSTLSVANGVATITVDSGSITAYNPALSPSNPPKGVIGHAYLLTFELNIPSTAQLYLGGVGNLATVKGTGTMSKVQIIYKPNSLGANNALFVYLGVNGASNYLSIGDSMAFKTIMATDLTLMLGSTIADYVYTLETQQAGKGVKWLKDYGFFSEPYYAYDGGSIKSVSGLVRHEMKDENDNVIGSYALDSTVELRGQFKMDADHNLYAEGDTYESSGKITRYWGERAYEDGDVSDYSTIITDGTRTIYKLTTPTVEQAEPFASPQNVDKAGTEEYVTNQSFVPIGHSTEYKCTPSP